MPTDPPQSPPQSPSPPPQKRLQAPASRLVFHVLADRTVLFAVSRDDEIEGHVLPRGREALAGDVARLREQMGVLAARGLKLRSDGVERDFDATTPAGDPTALLQALYRDLIGPVEHALPTDAPLVLEPHGPLWLLPFAALLDDAGRSLVDRCALQLAPSHDVLLEIEHEPTAGDPRYLAALIVGDPTMPTVPARGGTEVELAPLPGARKEAREVAALFEDRATVLIGAEASLERVREELPRHEIVHLATHGVAWPDAPLESFVALAEPPADSLLTARWLIDHVLGRTGEPGESRNPAMLDMVVLSACQTAIGQITGDGVIGLTRAFLIAGARSVIVSLWSVDDAATSALMVEFHRGYLAGSDKAVALQRAMQHVRGREGWAAPRYWAPFMLVGAAR